MQIISFLQRVGNLLSQFWRNRVYSPPTNDKVPPIRYLGDPKDIYLA